MAQAGSILANVRVIVGDPDRDFLTDSIGFDWINEGQRRFCHKVLALDEYKDYTVTAKQPRFDLPADTITPIQVIWYQSRVVELQYITPKRWGTLIEGWPNANGTPDAYTMIRRQLIVGPQRPGTNSATALASGTITAAGTTIGLTAASGTFRTKGWVKVENEIIEYTDVATTTLTGAVRGVHGTTAASHSSGTQVTEIDVQMLYRKAPAAISASGTEPDIPSHFHDYLEKYVLYLAWLTRGDSQKAAQALAEFETYERETAKTVSRRAQDGLLHIQERWRARWY